ncbi:hypothetical protein MHK_003671 [Candidatus Magnetomorum sp. HK-1]|nr:hypothetical protein MHK_003671 [Candidatus Magnetomorum sp. HK-1]
MKECFVIMPIGSGDAYETYHNRYKHIIEPAVQDLKIDGEQVFRSVRADFVSKSGSITRDLLTRLYRSAAVIADLTDLNPNVFYELGVRHALRSGTILIALKGTKPPFDVGDLRVIPYEDRVGAEKEAIPQIQEILKSLLESELPIDSPVLHAIPQLSELGEVKEYEARLTSIERDREVLRAQLDISERANLANQGTLEALRKAIENLIRQLSEPERRKAAESFESMVQKRKENIEISPAAKLRDVEVDRESIFVLMPLGQKLEPIYDVIQQAAQKAGLRTMRADQILAGGSILDQIFENIAHSGLIIADLTGRNQNVMYELGIANTMGKKTLLLAQNIEEVPFDVRHQRVLVYDMSFKDVKILEEKLIASFKQYIDDEG